MPSAEQYQLWQHPNGTWYVRWSALSGTRRISTGAKERRAAEKYLAQFQAGALSPAQPEKVTLSPILDQYLADRKPRVRSYRTLEDACKRLKEHMGFLEPDHLTSGVIRNYANKRKSAGRANGTIIREIVTLRAALRLAEAEKWITRAPIIKMPVSAPPPRDRWLTKEEAGKLLESCREEHVRLYVLLGLHTLARHRAITGLQWQDVDLKRGIIDFGRGWGNKRRAVVPITPQLKKALQKAQILGETDFVVEFRGKPVWSIKTGFKAAVRRAKLEKVTPHVLRHTGATWMALAGVPMADIARYLGDSIATAERVYAKFHPDYLRTAAKALKF